MRHRHLAGGPALRSKALTAIVSGARLGRTGAEVHECWRYPDTSPGSGPAELMEAFVVDAVVVSELVDDGDANLFDHLGIVGAHGADG